MTLDPEGALSLLLRAGGALWLLLTVAAGGLALVVWFFARATRRPALGRFALRGGAAVLGLWVAGLILSPVVLGGRKLTPGEELLFCGLDCHLHLTALRAVSRDGGVDVTMRARSDAKAAIEDPGHVQVSVVDETGHRWYPQDEVLNQPLQAGQGYERSLRFSVPAGTRNLALTANWRGTAAWLIPGPENPLVQRKTEIRVPVEAPQ